jgi:hypothetical protein
MLSVSGSRCWRVGCRTRMLSKGGESRLLYLSISGSISEYTYHISVLNPIARGNTKGHKEM